MFSLISQGQTSGALPCKTNPMMNCVHFNVRMVYCACGLVISFLSVKHLNMDIFVIVVVYLYLLLLQLREVNGCAVTYPLPLSLTLYRFKSFRLMRIYAKTALRLVQRLPRTAATCFTVYNVKSKIAVCWMVLFFSNS